MTTPLFPSTLPLPEQDGYSIRRGNDLVSVRLGGGPARVRRDSLGTPHEVTCTWMCDVSEYTYLIGWFRERVQARSAFFRIPLLIDAPVAVNHLARVLDGPEELASTRGHSFVVRATLEVMPNPIKSFTLSCQSVSDDRVIDGGSSDYAADMSEFPVGRQVLLLGCQGTVNGVDLDLDGTYTLAGAPSAGIRTLTNAPSVNADWTALRGTVNQIMAVGPAGGACVLLPE